MEIARMALDMRMLSANQIIFFLDLLDCLGDVAVERLKKNIDLWDELINDYLAEVGSGVTTEDIARDWKELY